MPHFKQELVALSLARGRDDGALGNENLTEMVSNLFPDASSLAAHLLVPRAQPALAGWHYTQIVASRCALPFTKQ